MITTSILIFILFLLGIDQSKYIANRSLREQRDLNSSFLFIPIKTKFYSEREFNVAVTSSPIFPSVKSIDRNMSYKIGKSFRIISTEFLDGFFNKNSTPKHENNE